MSPAPGPSMDSSEQSMKASTSVLVALTSREKALFFGGLDGDWAIPASLHFCEDSELRPETWLDTLTHHRPEVLLSCWNTPPLPASWLESPDCPLRYVCHVTGSVRRHVPRSFLERGGLISNWGDSISPQVAEHALLLALSALRNQAAWRPFIAREPGTRRIEEVGTRSLFGKRVGIHGWGSVARALVPLLRPFGVSLCVFSSGVPEELIAEAGARPCASLAELFASSEVLFECEAFTPQTAGSVTAELVEALPPQAVFVNIARGGLVDEPALLEAARRGRLRLALDVVAEEPIRGDSALCQLPDAILSPHIGGPTTDHYPDCGALALANLRRFLLHSPLTAAIDLVSYDRAT
jgi:phosphoglycerate dehydrogenase-like enzyme